MLYDINKKVENMKWVTDITRVEDGFLLEKVEGDDITILYNVIYNSFSFPDRDRISFSGLKELIGDSGILLNIGNASDFVVLRNDYNLLPTMILYASITDIPRLIGLRGTNISIFKRDIGYKRSVYVEPFFTIPVYEVTMTVYSTTNIEYQVRNTDIVKKSSWPYFKYINNLSKLDGKVYYKDKQLADECMSEIRGLKYKSKVSCKLLGFYDENNH